MTQFKQQLSAMFHNGLAKGFSQWGRNAKVLVATEGFWSIPMSWVFFYRPIFLNQAIGLSEVQIGLLSTILSVSMVVSPLVGGYLADKFGRKRVFMFFDSFSWLSSMIVWHWTQNVWHALTAYILEGFGSVVYSVWECMLVEDTTPKYRSSIYGTVSAIFNIGYLSTPVAGIIIGLYGIDSGTRMLFAISFASMTLMFTIRQMLLKETKLGQQIMKEKSFAGLKGYKESLSVMRKNRLILVLLLTSVLGSFYYASTTYLSLFLTHDNGLRLSSELASLMPTATAASALAVASLVVPKLSSRASYIKILTIGYGLGCVSLLFLSLSPAGSLLIAVFSGVVLGVYTSTSFSVSRTFLTNEIEFADARARAKILSITITLSSLLSLPAPTLMGYLFSINPRVPFILASATLAVTLFMLLAATKNQYSINQQATD
ncbi:MAG: MFS transporter [Candidatus Bathyarchaeia archaeon]